MVVSELIKTFVATLLYAREVGSGGRGESFCGRLKAELIDNWRDTMMLGVPGGLYLFQNNILFIALSHLDAATYQITYQLKILTTAIFSFVMLGKRYSKNQTIALVLLFIGVAMVQMPHAQVSVAVMKAHQLIRNSAPRPRFCCLRLLCSPRRLTSIMFIPCHGLNRAKQQGRHRPRSRRRNRTR